MTNEYNPDLIREAIKNLDLRTRMEFEVADAHHPESHVTAHTTGVRDLIVNPWRSRKEQVEYHRTVGVYTEDERELFEEYLRVYLPDYAKPPLPTEPGVYVSKAGEAPTPESVVDYRIFNLNPGGTWTEEGRPASGTVKNMLKMGVNFHRLVVEKED